jgi:hypothetical protein
MENDREGLSWQITARELQAALERLGLALNPLSPLAGLATARQVPERLDEGTVQTDQPAFRQALTIAAQPDLLVRGRIGGGSVDLMEFTLSRCQARGDSLALAAVVAEGQILLRLFTDSQAFIAWFMTHYAGKNEQTVANFIPPTVELGEFIYLLHAVDAFRIATFRSMLEYRAGQQPTLRLSEFMDSMRRSVRSRDIRWLLPAFLVLTPGLDPAAIDLAAEKTQILLDRTFLETHAEPGGGEQVLGFAEAGRTMGVEFYRTWLVAAGFEIRVAGPAGATPVERLFIAPTALANHLVQIETKAAAGQPVKVNHQALTYGQLEQKLNALFARALALPVAPPAPVEAAPASATPAAPASAAPVSAMPAAPAAPAPDAQAAQPARTPRFCPNCGTPLKPDARFCKNCGTKLI